MTLDEYKDIYNIVGAAMEVYNVLGRGMAEPIYQEALAHAQLFNYMRITQYDRGVLLNFGEKNLHAERFLYLPDEDDFVLLNQNNYMDYIIPDT